mmetsp:Transcript_11624/g.14691  ORF Transcript_11624/g.14691 Transcript_11624/m.14691 type:complete len:109 (+) Transcript_11624:1491-1817(+)
MINETDCLAALSHGANRAIFLGNSSFDQNMFLINPSSVNKILYYRIKNAMQLDQISSEQVPEVASPARPSPRKKGRASAAKKNTSPAKAVVVDLTPKVTFVDASASSE